MIVHLICLVVQFVEPWNNVRHSYNVAIIFKDVARSIVAFAFFFFFFFFNWDSVHARLESYYKALSYKEKKNKKIKANKKSL